MKRILTVIIFLTLPFLNIYSQIVLEGKINNSSNDESLIGAFVSIKGLDIYAVSDANGMYQIILPTPASPRNVIVNVTSLGFKEINQAVELLPIDDGESLIRNFSMEVDPLTLKDVTVTANKVEEDLQDVPIAATVIDSDNLTNRTVSDTEEAFATVPNLITDAYLPSRATFSLRGLASDFTNLGVENSVGLYIDDVFYSRSFNFNSTLMDIERVEVLRGPQGTLFGKNTVGGVLHIISEQPKFGNFGSIEFNAGNFNYLQARVKGNVELAEDKLAMRVAGAYRTRDGWLLERNPDLQDENKMLFYGGRLSFLYKPAKNVEVTVKGNLSKDDSSEFTIDYKTPDDGFDRIPVPEEQRDETDRRVFQNEDVFFNRESYGVVGKVKVNLGNLHTLNSITAINDSKSAFLRDFDASTANVGTFSKDATINTFSQEIRISTPRENRKFFYIAGLFYLKEELTNRDTLRARGDMAPIWTAAINQGIAAGSLPQVYGDMVIPSLNENYTEAVFNSSVINSESIAGFASGSYEISERIRFNAGLRYSFEKKDITYWQNCDCIETPLPAPINVGPMGLLVAPPAGSEAAPITRDLTNKALSGNFGMDFKTTDKILIYLNYTRGFKGAGFNVSLTPELDPTKVPFTFNQETINSYEIGLKLKTSNRYLFNAAAFVTDFRDKQEVVAVGNTVIVSNAKAVQGQGLELEFTGIWSDFFKTDVSAGFLNMEYVDFPFDNPTTPGVEENLSRNKAFKAPPYTLKFAPELHTTLGKELKFMARADYSLVGKTYNDIFNTEGLAREASGVLNARISFTTKNNRYSIALWGKNLTNTTYIQHAWSFIFGDHVSVNPPRTIGLELRANFY